MRVNLKVLLAIIVAGTFFTTVSYWTKCNETFGSDGHRLQPQPRGFQTKFGLQGLQNKDDSAYPEDGAVYSYGNNQFRSDLNTNTLEEIECLINGEYKISCRRDGYEVYVPFSFLHKYFEVYGKIVSYDGGDRFEWQHSYSKFYSPLEPYDPKGPFMHFKNYNVEARDRVKCISATDGVPVSTQWDAKGYYYPIQISQYGLSHYSKNLTEPEPRLVVLEDGLYNHGNWITVDGMSKITYSLDSNIGSDVMNFEAPESFQEAGIMLKMDQTSQYVMNIDYQFTNNGSFTVTLEDKEHHEQYYLHYLSGSKQLMVVDGTHAYYGLGSRHHWSHLSRDISIDFKKSFVGGGSKAKKGKFHFSKIKILYLTVRGSGALDNLTWSSSAHLAHFSDAATWLLNNQDNQGGWPIPVERKFSSSGMLNLHPGWYSAMAQGQAMSLLTRVYRVTGDRRYLDAAFRAVELFKIPTQDHGIMTTFLDRYVWYEEYPTIPSSFVLNGFIYALLGLYDLQVTCSEKRPAAKGKFSSCTDEDTKQVRKLYDDGMDSLKKMLPLFDSGATSIYDLRHFTLGVAPNLARWDYHTTHIDQLLLLATIDDDPILKTTAQRWMEYMKGKRAAHN